MGDLDTVVQEKIEKDSDFQTSIAALSDEEKTAAIAQKKSELIPEVFKEVSERAEKDAEIARDQKQRAEKAEGELKKFKPETKPAAEVKKEDLSSTDLYALMKAEVPEEDLEEVKRTAKALDVSIAEALKDPVTKAILERRQSLRKTAEATNTGTARPANKKVTDDEILAKASKGEIPERGSQEAEQLFWAKRGGKK